MPLIFNTITIIGIGHIGSSIAKVIKKHSLAKIIIACDSDHNNLALALKLGLADQIESDPKRSVETADLVILATPVGRFSSLAPLIAQGLKKGAILTDVGSVKASVIRDIHPHLPKDVDFVPGHPLAGQEHSGPESGLVTLFEGRWCVLTPLPETNPEAIEKVRALWERAGSMVEIMDPEHHDKVLAITSHLPHLIAYTIVGTATDLEQSLQHEVIKFSASGFRDFTRIAASDPIMWRDIFLNNREAVLDVLQRFSEDLTALQRAIRWGEGDTLEKLFKKTRAIRRSIIDAKQA
jgi:cyclohexadieny/prephenate dehydrogenase